MTYAWKALFVGVAPKIHIAPAGSIDTFLKKDGSDYARSWGFKAMLMIATTCLEQAYTKKEDFSSTMNF